MAHVFFPTVKLFSEMPEMTRSRERTKNGRSSTTPIGTPMLPNRSGKNKKRNSKNSVKLTASYQILKRRLVTITAKIWTISMGECQVKIVTLNSYFSTTCILATLLFYLYSFSLFRYRPYPGVPVVLQWRQWPTVRLRRWLSRRVCLPIRLESSFISNNCTFRIILKWNTEFCSRLRCVYVFFPYVLVFIVKFFFSLP